MVTAETPAKVTVTLEVTLVVDVTDDGYLGVHEPVRKHIEKAKNDAQGWQYLVKRGALEGQPVRARVRVRDVTIVPPEA